MSGQGRRRLRATLLTAVVALFVFSVPWYRAGGDGGDLGDRALWGGLPDWVAVAIACYAAAAVLNAVAWWLTELDE